MRTLLDDRKVILAPMAGVSDEAFRELCLEQGAQLTYTEMVSAKGLSYANERTRQLLDPARGEEMVAVQLFGREPDTMASQAAWIEDYLQERLAYIDVNMGCPARKIVSKGDGSALMLEPDVAAAIVRAIKGAIKHPVTCKFRRGYHEGEELAPAFAKRLEDAGADCLAVHGRYAMQMYRGSSDRGVIKRVVDAVSIPVIGNGDIRTGADAVSMVKETGCSAVMIGRASEGNPWVFRDVRAALNGEEAPAAPTLEERLDMARRHAVRLAERDGRNIVRMRKHATWYLSGLPGASSARAKINSCTTVEDFFDVFDEIQRYATEFLESR